MAKLLIAERNAVVVDAAHYLFDLGRGDHGTEEDPKTFTDLSDADRLTLVTDHQKQVIVDAANTYVSNRDQTVAREAAEDTKHTL